MQILLKQSHLDSWGLYPLCVVGLQLFVNKHLWKMSKTVHELKVRIYMLITQILVTGLCNQQGHFMV